MTQITPITLPKWGLEMSEGTVTGWHMQPGDSGEKGAELVDVETDKIVNCVELDAPGTLRRILVPEGEVAPVGALIAVMADASVDEAAIDAFVAELKPVDASFEPSDGGDKPAKTEPAPEAPKAEVRATPLARRTAEQSGVDLTGVQGSGHKGKVMRDDVAKAGAPKKSAEDVRAENSGVYASPIAVKFANEVGLGLSGLKGTGRKGRVSLGMRKRPPSARASGRARPKSRAAWAKWRVWHRAASSPSPGCANPSPGRWSIPSRPCRISIRPWTFGSTRSWTCARA